jgi:amino acid adenylation domain-containing protein/non-ribosomal peptide synthase protein (TIGR01720 family)/FkbM family methyltransferase
MSQEVLEGFQLSLLQKRLWLLSGGQPCGVCQCAVRLDGEWTEAELRAAIEDLCQRHESLRTVYRCLPGMAVPVQIVEPLPGYLLETGPAVDEADIDRLLDRERQRPFDTGALPLLRLLLCPAASGGRLLVITVPALCADRRSLVNLVGELSRALASEGAAAAPEGELVQYIDFSEWQHDLLAEPDREDVELWRHQESAAFSPPSLPQEWNGARPGDDPRVWLDIPPALAARIGTAQEVILLAGWCLLLGRLSGRADQVVDCLVDGRRVEPLAGAIGLFEKYLPLRLPVEAEFHFAELAAVVRDTWETACAHQDGFVPQEPPAAGAPPVPPRVGFELVDLRPQPGAGGLPWRLLALAGGAERFALRLAAVRSAAGLRLALTSELGTFSRESLEDLGERLLTLLAAALERPEEPLGNLAIVGPRERRRLLAELGWGGELRLPEAPVHRLFEAQADRTPDAVAVVCGERRLSFRELDRRANRLAWRLRALGVGPEERVGLCLSRSVEAVVALVAALKAGGAFVPFDLQQPRERLLSMARDAGLRAMVTDAAGSGLAPADIPRVELGSEDGEVAGVGDERPGVEVAPESLAYVIYTSGSTGRPKGVLIQHRSAVSLACALRHTVYGGGDEGLRVSVNAPLSFDASIKQVLQLLWGGTLHLIPDEARRDGAEMLRLVGEQRLDVVDCTPSQLELLLAAGLLEQVAGGRYLIGGEAINERLWQTLCSRPEIAFWNLYGPTECTVDATACRLAAHPGSPSIGLPLANVRVRVVTPEWTLAPAGLEGELWIGGAGVARGYLGRPELTAERFVPDPFGDGAGERLYRTGDRVRWRESGLEFIGRMDNQVKVRGMRIELGEIESVLLEHPEVSAAAVAQVTRGEEQRLVGYVVPRHPLEHPHQLPNGQWVAHQNRNETDYLYEEIFVKQIYLGHGISLPADACVLDVGANIGLFTLFVRQCCPQSRVYAFEPLAPIFATLEANVRRHDGHVRLFAHGLADREGAEELLYYRRYSMMSGVARYASPGDEVEVVKRYLRNQSREDQDGSMQLLLEADELLAGRFEGEVMECRMRPLSQILREEGVERVDLLKVDVQRSELAVLQGIEEADWERIDQVVMEAHDAPGRESEGRVAMIAALLKRHGYRVEVEQDELLAGTDRYNLYAWRPGRRPGEVRQGVRVPPAAASGLDLGELRELLRRRLPEAMVPAALVPLERLPLTRHGKLDRSALPAPEELERWEGDLEEPRTPFEELAATLFADVLRVDRVGIRESFFDLGGHSLLATQLMSRVREAFQVEMPLRVLFEAPTVAELALRLDEALDRGPERDPAPPLQRVSRDGELPLSFAQQRLWFLHQLEPESPAYNNPLALRLEGALAIGALAATLKEILRRHESLRTLFPAAQGRPRQEVLAAAPAALSVIDLSGLRLERREPEALRLARREARTPFDLAHQLPVRTRLLALGDGEHVLLWTTHHIVSDAWSLEVLMREASALYASFSQGRPSPLPELPLQYADYAAWQRLWLSGAVLDRELAFWRRQVEGAAVLELSTDRPRPARASYRGGLERLQLGAELIRTLGALGRSHGMTPFMILLAGFAALLARNSNQEDFNVGTAVAGRNRLETEGLVGFFVNTLVLRARLSGELTALGLLRQAREVSLAAYSHQDLPFELLVDEQKPERNLSHPPLVQAMLVFQGPAAARLALPGLRVGALEGGGSTAAKYDLELLATHEEERLTLAFKHRVDLFEAATVARMLRHLEALLGALAAAPSTRVWELPFLSTEEREELIQGCNPPWHGAAVEPTVAALFEAQVERAPEATALSWEGGQMSYRDLNRRANALATRLAAQGARPEALVGICIERSPLAIVALLAALKAGAAYLPLDPRQPRARLAALLAAARAPVVVTQRRPGSPAGDLGTPEIGLDEADLAAGGDDRNPAARSLPENLAYALFTSGSTGEPKAVAVEHRQIVLYVRAVLERLQLPPGAVYCMVSTFAADLGNTALFPALCTGGCLHLVSEELAVDAERLADDLESRPIDCLKIVPSHLEALLAASDPGRLLPRQRLVLGGESCRWDLVERARALRPGCTIFNHYGPTETTVGVLTHETSPVGPPHAATVPLGRPLGDSRIFLLDAHLQLVPAGLPGEICVAGGQLARGYLGCADLTASRFLPDALSGRPGERIYRTGDLARRLPDGEIEILGRLDQQVKIRGFRVEPGEVETVLLQHPAVEKAVVLPRPGVRGPRLVAYFVAAAPSGLAPELRSFLAERVPAHLLPADFVRLAALPLTPNGKIDRAALPDPPSAPEPAAAAPRDAAETTLTAIWAEVLGRDQVGIHDNFFSLGGDSILSIQIVARANQAGLRLTPRQMFEQQTIAELAAVSGSGPAIVAEQGAVTGPAPLTPIQERFFETGSRDLHHWNYAALLCIDPALDSDRLPQVVAALLLHHDALRLRFAREGEAWRQWIEVPPTAVPFTVLDLRALGEARRRQAIEAAAEAVQRSLDLTRGPLLRMVRFRLGRGERDRLLVVAHHLVVDGISWRILLEDLLAVWRRLTADEEPRLPLKTTSFQSWARRLAEHAGTAAVQAELPWWLAVVAHAAPLPRDRRGGLNTVGSARILSTALDAAATQALLTQVPGVYRTQINEVLLAALLAAFAGWTGEGSLVVDLEGHGREEILDGVDVLRTVGWFTAVFPVRLHAERSGDPAALIKGVKEPLRAIPNHGVGYSMLRYLSPSPEVRRQLSALPQAEVSFNYLGQLDAALAQAALLSPAPESRGSTLSPRAVRRYLLDLNARVVGGELRVDWTYSENVHDEVTVERLAQGFLRALEGLISHCLSPEAGGLTPADFPQLAMTQGNLDRLLAQVEDLEELEDE